MCICKREILQGCWNIVWGSLYILQQAAILRLKVCCWRHLKAQPGAYCSPVLAAQIPAFSGTCTFGVSFPGTSRLLCGQLRGKEDAQGCRHGQKVSLSILPCAEGFRISSRAIPAHRGIQEQVALQPHGPGSTVGPYSDRLVVAYRYLHRRANHMPYSLSNVFCCR